MKAIVGIEIAEQVQARCLEIARRADAGETPLPEADYHLNFATAAQLFSELTPARLALLEMLQRQEPVTIHQLAKRLGRNDRSVHQDVSRLLDLELIDQDAEGRVFVPWERIELHLAFSNQRAA